MTAAWSKRLAIGSCIAAAALTAVFLLRTKTESNSSALWNIVSTSCVPAARTNGTGRCAEVELPRSGAADTGYVVMKDRNGVLQYLLMPTRRVTGIEDPYLLTADAPDYWEEAWRARRWMDKKNGTLVPRDDVALTVNSKWGRSQNQLHIHISCVRPDLKLFLASLPASKEHAWTPLAQGWQGHAYEVRPVTGDTLTGQTLFKDLAQQYGATMDEQAIAVVGAQIDGQPGFWLMRTRTRLPAGWNASIESDVQDHACTLLRAPA